MMRAPIQRTCLSLATFCLVATGATSGDTETHYGLGVVAGYDSNPLLVVDDEPGGAFTQLGLSGGVIHHLGAGATAALFVDGRAATRIDDSRTSDAGYDAGRARAGLAFSPAFAGRRLMVSLGGRYSTYRGTFTDRETGAVYEANVVPATDPPSTLPIADRLDYDGVGAFLDLRWRQNRRWTLTLETALGRTDYVEDYTEMTDLDALDYRVVTVRPGATVRLGALAELGLGVALTDLDYDDRPALDSTGTEVPGTTRTYRYTEYQAMLRVRPSEPWDLSVGLEAGGRDDTYAGYYDTVNRSGSVALKRALGPKASFRISAALREVDYDRARVLGDAGADVRANDERRFVGRFTRSFGDRLRWYVEGGTEQTDSREPLFVNDREWILTGLHFGR